MPGHGSCCSRHTCSRSSAGGVLTGVSQPTSSAQCKGSAHHAAKHSCDHTVAATDSTFPLPRGRHFTCSYCVRGDGLWGWCDYETEPGVSGSPAGHGLKTSVAVAVGGLGGWGGGPQGDWIITAPTADWAWVFSCGTLMSWRRKRKLYFMFPKCKLASFGCKWTTATRQNVVAMYP